MTQTNGIVGTSDPCLPSAAAVGSQRANGMEQEKVREVIECESEDGGLRGEGRSSAAVPGVVTAPDGGWGWVVLLATIIVMALTLAFPACVGIFYTDLQNDFDATNSQTSWVPSIMTSVLHAGGKVLSLHDSFPHSFRAMLLPTCHCCKGKM